MYRARFYPVLQRPLRILLWELEDLALTIFLTAVFVLIVDPFSGVLAALATLAILPCIKRGKPPGWIIYMTYRLGVFTMIGETVKHLGLLVTLSGLFLGILFGWSGSVLVGIGIFAIAVAIGRVLDRFMRPWSGAWGLTPAPLPFRPTILCLSPSWKPSDEKNPISEHTWARD